MNVMLLASLNRKLGHIFLLHPLPFSLAQPYTLWQIVCSHCSSDVAFCLSSELRSHSSPGVLRFLQYCSGAFFAVHTNNSGISKAESLRIPIKYNCNLSRFSGRLTLHCWLAIAHKVEWAICGQTILPYYDLTTIHLHISLCPFSTRAMDMSKSTHCPGGLPDCCCSLMGFNYIQ